MEVNWRGAEYEFTPRTLEGGKDNWSRYSNIDGLIFGADTESVQLGDRYEPQCFSLSDPFGCDFLEYFPEQDFGLKTFLSYVIVSYQDYLLNSKNGFIYFHNLEYDWLQLVKNHELLLEMARIGVGLEKDRHLFKLGSWNIILKKNALFSGSAPHFTIRVERGKRIGFNLHFRDSFSFFPKSLAKVCKELGLPVEKMDRQGDLGKRDFRVEGDSEDKAYFEEYAKIDARGTRLAGERIRELHQSAGMTKIRASAPAYAIQLLIHMMEETDELKTGCWDQSIMQLILDTYRGGRTGGIYHGRVDHLSVLDFHSSYPASMLSLPSFNSNMQYVRLDDLHLDNVIPILEETGNAFLLVSGEETDPNYPSLIQTVNGKLTPIYGTFSNVATTGVELLVGIKSGSLQNLVIHEAVVLLDMDDDPKLPFKQFASEAYKRKADAEKDSAEYASAKLALNASYGKLIESRTQTLIGAKDYRAHLPFIEGMEKEFGNYYYEKYLELVEEGKTLNEGYDDVIGEIIENFDEETREKMATKMFGDFSISGRVYGRYVIPAAASLITATSRARLCCAMKALDALYWDTDSVFINEMDEEEIRERLQSTMEWLPSNVVPVQIGDELGELDCEIKGARGYLAGVKRYHLVAGDKVKSATHGIPALPRDKIEEVISTLATGNPITYHSKERPLKAKESKSKEEIGSFKSKDYTSEFHLDERLDWFQADGGWIGRVKPIEEMKEKKPTKKEIQMTLEFTGGKIT